MISSSSTPDPVSPQPASFKIKIATLFIAAVILMGIGFNIIDFKIFSKYETCVYIGLILFLPGLFLFSRCKDRLLKLFPRMRPFEGNVLFTLLFILVGIVALLGMNIYTDTSLPEEKHFTVIDKHIETYKNGKSYFADIARPDFVSLPYFFKDTQSIRVTAQEYNGLAPNSTDISLMVHPGALGFPWYESYTLSGLSFSTSASIEPLPNHLSGDVKEACLWASHFDANRDIEKITSDNAIHDFWPNGAPRSVEPTVNGVRHGIAHYTFANGTVYGDIPWKHGQKHGAFKLYREDGTLDQFLSYKDGVPYGIQKWFLPNGELSQSQLSFDDGRTANPSVCRNFGIY